MRTTLNIDDDVLTRARHVANKQKVPFRYVINEAMRAGLSAVEEPVKEVKYETQTFKMGQRRGVAIDNVQEVLSVLEGEDQR